MARDPIYPETDQPIEDWAEQRELGDPDDTDGEAPDEDDAVERAVEEEYFAANEADLAEQARALPDDEPYPRD